MSDAWYYDDRFGPIDFERLKKELAAYPNPKDVLVWRERFSNWVRAEDIPELSELFASVPPPLPPKVNWKLGFSRIWIFAAVCWAVIVAFYVPPLSDCLKYIVLALGPTIGILLLWCVGYWILAGFKRRLSGNSFFCLARSLFKF